MQNTLHSLLIPSFAIPSFLIHSLLIRWIADDFRVMFSCFLIIFEDLKVLTRAERNTRVRADRCGAKRRNDRRELEMSAG